MEDILKNVVLPAYLIVTFGLAGGVMLGYTAASDTALYSTSLPVILVAFSSPYLAALVPSVGFLLSALPVVRGQVATGRWFILILVAIVALSAGYFWLSWPYGLRYQGETVLHRLALLNTIIGFFLIAGATYLRLAPKRLGNLVLHGFFWMWIGWIAFPWIGEWP